MLAIPYPVMAASESKRFEVDWTMSATCQYFDKKDSREISRLSRPTHEECHEHEV